MILEVIFWIFGGSIIYAYLIYPGVLQFLFLFYKKKRIPSNSRTYPRVSILMSVYNEEIKIEEKVKTLFSLDYPEDNFEVIIGSDDSNDNTNEILSRLSSYYEALTCIFFEIRKGKPSVINVLKERAEGEILLITDANVMPEPDALKKMVSLFMDKNIGLVDSRLRSKVKRFNGIARQEKTYIDLETRLKYHEGIVTGSMMGPSGGFYAIKKNLYSPVPENFLADDFFINMNVLLSGYRSMMCIEAIVNENVQDNLKDQFRRKIRISTGNFQNLRHFGKIFLRPWKRIFLVYFSHKILRWFGPHIFMITLVCNYFLMSISLLYMLLFILQLIFILLPALDIILKRLNIHILPLRFLTHFVIMNLALLRGHIRSIGKVSKGIWEPTKRVV